MLVLPVYNVFIVIEETVAQKNTQQSRVFLY